ncbi:methyltransferase type 11 [Streptomyces sulfonofaciens]|uniref:Methyltransferase type 11 n=1 Tax=Streptomyces sulfonofaciens TaxID=68272 RepID=A0A919L3W0_9ACTN|nr:class I SAM-dependent methyltransferase [Streptomyces sulfonofaciens]GHH83023.1 methyltransferase type 11 [Streptomyces sulfonofaciens]
MLRDTFNEDAEGYDRARPRYPPALVDDLTARAGLGAQSRVLEIGPGTGQLTVPLARTGCRITAVELGPSLAAVARRHLAPFPAARVEVADFERWPLPPRPFDLAVSATAFHWLDPVSRADRAADALRPGGLLALVTTHHVAGGSNDFFARAQDCYERWDPATPPGLRLEPETEVGTDTAELTRSHRFGPVTVHHHPQEITYTTAQYLAVLHTYSGHRALPAPALRGLFDCLGRLIEDQHGGRITKRYLHELIVAERR